MYIIDVRSDLCYIYTHPDSNDAVGRRLIEAGTRYIKGLRYNPTESNMNFDWTGENFYVPVRFDSISGYCCFRRFTKYLNALKTYLNFMDVAFTITGLPKKIQLTNNKGKVYARYM